MKRNVERAAIMMAAACMVVIVSSCTSADREPQLIAAFPADGLHGLVDTTSVYYDEQVSSDGDGSLRVTSDEPFSAHLYELDDVDVENAMLIYRAQVKTRDVDGHAYVEMVCHFPDGKGYFSRALETPLYGTSDWTTQETPFDLKKGETPLKIEVNLVISGSGTVWIDEIEIWAAPRSQ